MRITSRRRTHPTSTRLRQAQVIAEASSADELVQQTPTVSTMPEGSHGEVRIRGFWGLGAIADLAGAETVWRTFLNPEGLEILGVHGEGFSTAVVEFANPVSQSQGPVAPQRFVIAVIAILIAIAGVLAVLAWVISKITVLLFGTSGPSQGLVSGGGLLLGAMVIAGLYLTQRPQRRAPS